MMKSDSLLANAVIHEGVEISSGPEAEESTLFEELRAKYSSLRRKPWFKPLRRAIILALYFMTGILFYTSKEGWSVGTAVAFIIVTISTVGFGYHTPSTDDSRLFTIFYMIFGIYFVFLVIADSVTHNFNYYSDLVSQKIKSATEVGQEYKLNFIMMICNIIALLACVLIGASILVSLEGWTFTSALYYAVQTSTSVGYGDLNVENEFTHLFMAFYIIFSTILFAFAFNNLQKLRAKRTQLQQLETLTMRRQHMDFISDLDTGLGVTEDQFVLALLLHFGTISLEDVKPWSEKFVELDAAKQGRLFKEDLTRFMSSEQAAAEQEIEKLEASGNFVQSVASSFSGSFDGRREAMEAYSSSSVSKTMGSKGIVRSRSPMPGLLPYSTPL